MPRINTNDAADFIADGMEFTSNGALSGHYDAAGNYVVRSYNTPILVWDRAAGVIYLNRIRYSNTTSRHQETAARAVAIMATGTARISAGDGPIMITDPDRFETATGYRVRVSKFATVN